MSKKLQFFPELFFILIIMFFNSNVSHVLGDESEAASRLSQAEDSIEAAYLSLLETERAGGDISELVVILNAALEYLSEADIAFEKGEHEEALLMAGKVIGASNVVLEANSGLLVVAEYVESSVLRNHVFTTFGSIFFITLSSFLAWRLFKDYYVRRMKGLRPELVVDEP